MSEKLCTLRGAGGGGAKQTETVLWTNSSPSSAFSPATVTLSDDINNYDYIKFTFAYNNNNFGSLYSEILPVDVIKLANWNICADVTGAGYHYTRLVNYATDTTIAIGNSYRWNGSTSGAPSNTTCIPISIIGIKNMGGIRTDEKYDSLPFQSVAGNAIPVFSTKGMAKAIWVVRYVSSMAKAVTYSNVNPYTGEIDDSNTYYYDSSTPSVVGTTSSIKFIVTNGQITTSASFSNAAHLLQLSYTY